MIPHKARQILKLFPDALIVGGFVRDSIQGVPSSDVDIEVYGLSLDRIEGDLSLAGFRVDAVGKAFGVLKVDNEIDVSVPRRENKVGVGHRDFNMVPDAQMSVREAAARRDFTINSMAMRTDGSIVDPFGGLHDIEDKVLRHTSEAFAEDPLRVLRGMQFASRFDMRVGPCTALLCQSMNLLWLSKERVWAEWRKWAGGAFPSAGLRFLDDCNQLPHVINHLRFCNQDPDWHPEGDVFVHTCQVVDQAARIAVGLPEEDRLVLLFAALCHDLGKPSVTEKIDGRWRARGHCEAGVPISRKFLEDIGAPGWLVERVLPLVADHLVHAGGKLSSKAVRRLAVRLDPASVSDLVRLGEADHCGRHPLPPGNPMEAIGLAALELAVLDDVPAPILMGRHLIERGMTPGPTMGHLLARAYEAQLDGEFDDIDGAIRWLDF